MKKKNQHVVPHGENWAVRVENGEKVTKIFNTQKEAIELAKEIAIKKHSELIIHSEDGKINRRNSYGNDNFPPLG